MSIKDKIENSSLKEIIEKNPPPPELLTDANITAYLNAENDMQTAFKEKAGGAIVALIKRDPTGFIVGSSGITDGYSKSLKGGDALDLALSNIYGGSENVPVDPDRHKKVMVYDIKKIGQNLREHPKDIDISNSMEFSKANSEFNPTAALEVFETQNKIADAGISVSIGQEIGGRSQGVRIG